MIAGILGRLALLGVVVLVAVIAFGGGGDDGYEVKLRMANAGGLKDGSPVTIGGAKIGKVAVDVDPKGDVAVVTLKIDDKYAPIGQDAKATIRAQNLLGQKQVQLAFSQDAAPARSGFVIPLERITEATDLDRVLSVLDADTRTRLAVFVNEAGTAFTGRRADFNRFLKDIGPAIANATDLVGEIADDNQELGQLVETSDRYVAQVTARRRDVVRFIDRVGEAAETGATKRTELRRTLAEAPGSLRTLRTFLQELRATTGPLGPAARQLSEAATPLQQTLDQLEPFRAAAAPALATATRVAPTLDRLALKATPVLRRAVPATAAVRKFGADDLPPVLDVTDRSVNNILAVLDNWSGAIQFSDQLSHVFRGEASFSPDAIQSVIERLAPKPKQVTRRRRPGVSGATPQGGARPALPAVPKAPRIDLPGLPKISVPDVARNLQDSVDGLIGGLTGSGKSSDDTTSALLDFLLR